MRMSHFAVSTGLAAVLLGSYAMNYCSAEACRRAAVNAITCNNGDGPARLVADQRTTMPGDQKMQAPAMAMMTKPSLNIVQTAVGPGMQTVTTLVKAVQAAELVDALQQPGPFTVFAPTNDAFAKLPVGTIDELLKPENRDKLRAILLYHVHGGEAIKAADLSNGGLSTLNGKSLSVKVDGPTILVDGATVTKSDVLASNGVIHWIDTVVLPPAEERPMEKMSSSMDAMRAKPVDIVQTAVGPGMQTVTTLVTAVQAAELIDALQGEGPFTVFAPTNDAFAKLPPGTIEELLKPENREKLRSILLYHVHGGDAIRAADLKNGTLTTLNGKPVDIRLDGPTITVGNATVTKSDVIASNGVIHWLDTVILP
jgi:transforming growth factor-beta-induced protein